MAASTNETGRIASTPRIPFAPIPYRIRIGVTGHRKLGDEPALESLVRRAIETKLDELFDEKSRVKIQKARADSSPPVLYSVVSPLAEGADRLVARVVLSYDGARLDAVLPLSPEDYLEDFKTAESRAEFQRLLDQCRRPVYLRKRRISADCEEREDPDEMRREAYENVGQYVVSHCDVLIALWDGKESQGRGGTAEIVEYAREQKRPVIRVWKDGAQDILTVEPGNRLNATALNAVERFNRPHLPAEEYHSYQRNLERDYFEKPATAGDVPEEVKEIVRTYLFPYYMQASSIAKNHQKRFNQAGKFVYGLSALSVACVALALLVPALSTIGFAAEFAFLAVAWFTGYRAHSSKAQENWMENRFLAERIRSGIMLAVCGVDPAPIEVLPFMGPAHATDDWMIRAFSEIWTRLPRLPGCSHGECLPLNRYVREVWLQGQIEFHRGKQKREGRAGNRLVMVGRVAFPLTMAAAMLHMVWGIMPAPVIRQGWLHALMTMIAILFPAIAASSAGLRAQREHLRLERRSESMIPQLENLNLRMASATHPKKFEKLLMQVDEVMLRETQEWLMLMRFVEFEGG